MYLTKTDNSNEHHFEVLTQLLNDSGNSFSMKELYDLYSEALNYCIQKVNQGRVEFFTKFHDLYNFMLDKGIAYNASNSGELSPWHFKNAVLSALRLGHYEWAERFIKNSQDKLPVDFRDNAVTFNLSLLYFYQKRYDKATTLLQSVEYEDIAYNLDSKSMLLAMYYEQDEDEALMSLMDSFKTYLNRHKDLPDRRRMLYSNLIKFH